MSDTSSRALLVIDLQNDYFPGGKFPLWNTDGTLNNVTTAIQQAQQAGDLVVLIQHVADPAMGIAPSSMKVRTEPTFIRVFVNWRLMLRSSSRRMPMASLKPAFRTCLRSMAFRNCWCVE